MITIWRRHTPVCPHRNKGREYMKCGCPLWADGYVEGKRTLRQSLKTRDLARARKQAAALESPDQNIYKPVSEAIAAFIENCHGESLQSSTVRKYRNTLDQLQSFCDSRHLDSVSELTTDHIASFRAGRALKPITASKELQLLKQFCGFCADRKWADENVASRVKAPRNIKPNDVEPFSAAEVSAILTACDGMGRSSYERLRAKAMILTLRFTALRIGDVAMLARDRISKDGNRWRIYLRTEKSGKPVFLPIPTELKLALDALPGPRGANRSCRYYFWNGSTSERAVKGIAERTLSAVFKRSGVQRAHDPVKLLRQ